MALSFSAKKRRATNRQIAEVQQMLATAETYDFNRGESYEADKLGDFVSHFSAEILGSPLPNSRELGRQLAAETVNSRFPDAVNAAWLVAVELPSSKITELSNMLGPMGVTNGATFFTDEFPDRVKEPILGRKLNLWRGPAAIATTILATHAAQMGYVWSGRELS